MTSLIKTVLIITLIWNRNIASDFFYDLKNSVLAHINEEGNVLLVKH